MAVVRALLEKGAKINMVNEISPAPFEAVKKKHLDKVELDPSVDESSVYDGARWPPLKLAAKNGHDAVVRLLVDKVA